jgi:adenylosuccinate lyase
MTQANIMAISPLDGRYYDKLSDLRPIFSEYGFIKWRVIVEIRWLQYLFTCLPELQELTPEVKSRLEEIGANFSAKQAWRIKELEATTKHDVKAIEYFLKEQVANEPQLASKIELIHFGCTSEDINNLAYGLMLTTARKQCLLPALNKLIAIMRQLAHDYAELPMLARTHGQAASPSTLGKEIANFVSRLNDQQQQLEKTAICGKLNGASGNYNTLAYTYPAIDWQTISAEFVRSLSLKWQAYTTQIEPHDYLAEFFAIISRINNILIACARDIWGYISLGYLTQTAYASETGSSVMPHKINPIDFENAEGNLGVANAMLNHMSNKLPISRWQRDLSDSTVLRNIGVALGHSVIAYQAITHGLTKITANVAALEQDLQQHWEVLAEPIQTIMRLYNINSPYEQLKTLTRGNKVTPEILQQFIKAQDLPAAVKTQLLALTPQTYLGYAAILAKNS